MDDGILSEVEVMPFPVLVMISVGVVLLGMVVLLNPVCKDELVFPVLVPEGCEVLLLS